MKRFRRAFFSRKRLPRSDPADRRTVAENHQLTGIFQNLETAPIDLGKKPVHTGKPFYVSRLAPDHRPLLHGLGLKQIRKPILG
ncbi:hypothetical protein JQU17_08825 [Ponticoccus sp. SC2-23]|uniref:hypothetical protein n=1 Tax=Alexandriicola marinus TaxID=2081710 RepID=UPI0013DEC515|nr:hypothetical protein [Ponticoccus sp. SC6-9]MBM1224897.1 hypothetical protein [Ponticoccus sp. SC6-15]MBM1233952.1 hypothetical protein [Ponticoccus sp. SC6-45]MBM1238912.1 hypothetical protein [Ponticoccus sp. SC6-49]MBM1242694.1 hypothetical protein [Ponticoccus sp. SC2-64]MBM1247476.1 hypothetical protein [Ponticoccus sp. SC6-42]MBM1251865.1 hypothetical protein [Ponticoccus sp. SC6-33]MBM1256921.1 hypothetical protein [Ponticoccus sp. SC6-60]MBM1260965.1 hypothetical protein [Pontico